MFAFIEPEDAEKKMQKFLLYNAGSVQLTQLLEASLANEGNFKSLGDIGEWKLWVDPTGKISRKKFDAYLKEYLIKAYIYFLGSGSNPRGP